MHTKNNNSVVQVGRIKISPFVHAIVLIALWAIIRAGVGAFFKDSFGGELTLVPTMEFTLFSVLCFVVGGIGLVYFGLIRLGHVSWHRLGWTRRQLGRSVLLGIIGFFVGIGIVILLNALVYSNDLSAQFWPVDIRKVFLGALWGFAIAAWIEQNLFAGLYPTNVD